MDRDSIPVTRKNILRVKVETLTRLPLRGSGITLANKSSMGALADLPVTLQELIGLWHTAS